jgi:hypothetical protein
MTGKLISHYEITDKLGEGGMGVTDKVRDTDQGDTFVIENYRQEPFSAAADLGASWAKLRAPAKE